LEIRRYFNDKAKIVSPAGFLRFLVNKVLFIYVATPDLDDGYRLFMRLHKVKV
jgi:hypothetical protein